MTDEEIIALAEKTKEEKHCVRFERRYGDCKLKEFPYTRCTMKRTPVCDEWDNLCEGEGYKLGFLDGFKAAMEYINQIPHFLLKHDNNTEIIEKFRDSPELYQTYLSEMEKNIQCIINGILSREK